MILVTKIIHKTQLIMKLKKQETEEREEYNNNK
jgi:hypothetical protein